MNDLAPLEALYDTESGTELPLPVELAHLYGVLRFPSHPGRPHVVGNFVTTLDGVVALGGPERSGGGEISGFNPHDRVVMGLLRSVADAVIVGAGTLRSVPDHLWTADYIYPPLADAYRRLRTAVGKEEPPLNVIVTGRGEIDLELPVFRSGRVPALIVAAEAGARRLQERDLPPSVRPAAVEGSGPVGARAVLEAVRRVRQSDLILVEGGPHLMDSFFAEGCLDELFLTLAPQVAGRDGTTQRLGLVAGSNFAPGNPLWGSLVGVKRGGSHLFLRYSFEAPSGPEIASA